MAECSSKPFDLSTMDDETAALVLRLQFEDIQSIQSSGKGKNREDEISDSAFAIKAFGEEVQLMTSTLSDRAMGRSLARAVITDSALITEAVAKEDIIANDRVLAERVSKGDETACAAAGNPLDPAPDDLLIARLTALYIDGTDVETLPDGVNDDDSPISESSGWAARRTSKSKPSRDCVSCGDLKHDFEVLRSYCGHCYCQQCLSTLFELSMTDETLFPPRCCRQVITLESARLYLDVELVRRFKKKSVELTTANRTYCSRPTCSLFITPANITTATSTAYCTLCSTTTCTICKGNSHDGDCPEDVATQLTLAAAQEQGWQRCYSCGLLVELDTGCNHMTCRCRAQFCYVCGLRWKTCACPQWTEERLLARAQQVVARRPPEGAVAEARQVQQAVEHLRERHNCTHQSWRWINGPHQCEECRYNLPQYIFECRQCRIQVCNRCKRNRL